MKKKISVLLVTAMVAVLAVCLSACTHNDSTTEVAKDVKISESAIGLSLGGNDSKKLVLKDDKDKELSGAVWTSANTEVATVEDGVVRPVAIGKTTIQASLNGKIYSCEVVVNGTLEIDPENFSIQFTNVEVKTQKFEHPDLEYSYPVIKLAKGQTLQLNHKFIKKSNEDKNGLSYASTDTSNVTVSSTGLVTAVQDGVSVISIISDQIHEDNYQVGMVMQLLTLPAKAEVIVFVGEDKTAEQLPIFFKDLKDFEGGYDYQGSFGWKGFETMVDTEDPDGVNEIWNKDNLVQYDGNMNLRLWYDGTFAQAFYDNLPRQGWVKNVDESLPETTNAEAYKKYGEAYRFPAGMFIQEGNIVVYGDYLYLVFYHEYAVTNLSERVIKLCKVTDSEILNYDPIDHFERVSDEVKYDLKTRQPFAAEVKVVPSVDMLREVDQTVTFKLMQGRKELTDAMWLFGGSDSLEQVVPMQGEFKALNASGDNLIMVMCGDIFQQFNYTVKLYELIPNTYKGLALIGNKIELSIVYDKTNEDVTSKATYISSDEQVATVSETGVVEGIHPGEAIITVKYDGKEVAIKVSIRDKYRNYEENMEAMNADQRIDSPSEEIFGYTKEEIIADMDDAKIEPENKLLANESNGVQKFLRTMEYDYVVIKTDAVSVYGTYISRHELVFIQLKAGADGDALTAELNGKVDAYSNSMPTIAMNETFKYDATLNIIYKAGDDDLVSILKGDYQMTANEVLSQDGTVLFAVRDEKVEDYTIPSTVTKISSRALARLPELRTLTFNDKVVEIGYEAFLESGYRNMTEGWFVECKLPASVKKIADRAFRSNLFKTIELNEGLEEIGSYALAGTSFRTITFPSTLKTLGKGAFRICNMDGTVDLSKTQITVIPEEFIYDSSVEYVILPEGLTTIGDRAFSEAGVDTINIPSTVTEIGVDAFTYEPIYSKDPLQVVTIDSATVAQGLIENQIEILRDAEGVASGIKCSNFGGIVANVATIYVKDTITTLGTFFSSKNVYKEANSDKPGYVKYTQTINLNIA